MSRAWLRAEPSNRQGRMVVRFLEYDVDLRKKLMKIPGAQFVGPTKPEGPCFRIQMDMQTCDQLLETFGKKIEFSEEIVEWGKEQRRRATELAELAVQEDATADLSVVERKLAGRMFYDKNVGEMRELWPAFRPDQRLGTQWLSTVPNGLEADEAGLGKTWQVIASIMARDGELGRNLIICPKISIENVWLPELNAFQDEMVFVAPEGRKQRERLMEEVAMCLEDDLPFWLVVNPAMVTLRSSASGGDYYDHLSGRTLSVQFPFMFEVQWTNIVIDEAQDSGIANPSSQFSRAMKLLHSDRRIAMSGTPMGGKPERLWGILHWLEPHTFTSKHTWLKRWAKERNLETREGRKITVYEGVKGSLEEEFYNAHRQYMIRRKKADVIKDLPPITHVDLWVDMTPAQHRQYELMDEEAIANVYESEQVVGRVSMANILATNTWLKQFANGYCDLEERERVWNDFTDAWEIKYNAIPTMDSPKLDALHETLKSIGVNDILSGKQAIVFSQFSRWADMIEMFLELKGYSVAKITGKVTSRAKREQLIKEFQAGERYQVMVMTTKAGGVSVNLDRADDVFFFDETYNPDEQEQAWNRAHRAGYLHNVTVHWLRTRRTIEEDVLAKVRLKQNINDILLDRYRQAKERLES